MEWYVWLELGFRDSFLRFWRKIKGTAFEIKVVNRVLDLKSGRELTEENDGCTVHGYLVRCEIKKIIDIGGTVSKGFVIPKDMIERFSQKTLDDGLKIHLLQQVNTEPILVATSADTNLKIGLKERT